MAYYAQIKDGIVYNIIKLDDSSLEEHFTNGFDDLVNLGETRDPGQPGPGWTYENDEFSPPEEE